MHYVTCWRMHLALSALREEEVTVAVLASRLGYRSEAASAGRSNASSASRPAPCDGQRLDVACATPWVRRGGAGVQLPLTRLKVSDSATG
jgi:hypothetical protein